MPEDIPDEAQQARYSIAAPHFETRHLDYEVQIAWQVLRGVPLEQALNDERSE